MQGSVTMESKTSSLGGIFKSMATGESIFRPTYTGIGTVLMAPLPYWRQRMYASLSTLARAKSSK